MASIEGCWRHYPAPDRGARAAGLRQDGIVSDALTIYARDQRYWFAIGCEAAGFHHNGGNFVFLDGHAKRIARNAERYLKRNSAGQWFEQFFTYDME